MDGQTDMSKSKRDNQVLGPTGLNLIRIVISAYFIAVSLDWTEGFNKGALFLTLSKPDIAHFTGSMLLFYLAFVYLCGFHLRLSALFLAVFVLASALVDLFVYQSGIHIGSSGLSRDLAFVCAIMLSYASLSRQDLKQVAVLRSTIQPRSFPANKIIAPTRLNHSEKPAAAPVSHVHPSKPQISNGNYDPRDKVNIFADV